MPASVIMHKAEKYAFDRKRTTETVRSFCLQNFGCARKVYNLYVDFLYNTLESCHYTGGGQVEGLKLPEVSSFKAACPYLKDADSLGLANAKLDFQDALVRYNQKYDHVSYTKRAIRRDKSGTEPLSFRGLKGMPKFHAKAKGCFSYTTNCQYPAPGKAPARPTIRLTGNVLYLPKLREGIPLVIHRKLPDNAVIGNVTISMDPDGTLYASIGYSYTVNMDMRIRNAALSGDAEAIRGLSFLGLDYSQPDFYVDSEGRKANCPHSYRKNEARLVRAQQKLARMEKGSAHYNKQLAKVQAIHKKSSNQRKDFVCKEADYLAKTYDVIAVEDIDLRAMGSTLSLGKNLHDNGFGMFRTQLAHKLEEKGSVLVKVDRWFPSTKMCARCGTIDKTIVLGVSEWTCPACGEHHYRDPNAAVNIRDEGRRIFPEYMKAWLSDDDASRRRAAARTKTRKQKAAKASGFSYTAQ